MKKFMLLLLLCIVAAATAGAQDIIVLSDGSTIQAKVISVGSSEVQYKKWSNLDGPTYTQAISGILAINYQNGTQDRFNAPAAQTAPAQAPASPAATTNSSVVTRETASSFSTDRELLTRYENSNYANYVKKAHRGKVLTIVGGSFFVAGASLFIYGLAVYSSTFYAIGAPIMGVGLGLGTWGIVQYSKNRKLMNQVATYALWDNEFKLGNGTSVNLGVDMLHDYATRDRGLGVGLRLNF